MEQTTLVDEQSCAHNADGEQTTVTTDMVSTLDHTDQIILEATWGKRFRHKGKRIVWKVVPARWLHASSGRSDSFEIDAEEGEGSDEVIFAKLVGHFYAAELTPVKDQLHNSQQAPAGPSDDSRSRSEIRARILNLRRGSWFRGIWGREPRQPAACEHESL